jgi:hypothetical protein
VLNEHIAEHGALFAHACRLGAEADRQQVSIWLVSHLDQGPQSRQHRRAAGARFGIEKPEAALAS